MKAMMDVWRNITLSRAFNGWAATVEELQEKHALQAHAMAFWSSRELAQACLPACSLGILIQARHSRSLASDCV